MGLGLSLPFAFVFFFLMIFVISILSTVFWILMIIDVAKRKFKNDNDKILWILVIVLTGIIGALIYYFVVKRKNKH